MAAEMVVCVCSQAKATRFSTVTGNDGAMVHCSFLRLSLATLPIGICKNSFRAKERDENNAAKRPVFQQSSASLAAYQ
jgi:hypothetical protein